MASLAAAWQNTALPLPRRVLDLDPDRPSHSGAQLHLDWRAARAARLCVELVWTGPTPFVATRRTEQVLPGVHPAGQARTLRRKLRRLWSCFGRRDQRRDRSRSRRSHSVEASLTQGGSLLVDGVDDEKRRSLWQIVCLTDRHIRSPMVGFMRKWLLPTIPRRSWQVPTSLVTRSKRTWRRGFYLPAAVSLQFT